MPIDNKQIIGDFGSGDRYDPRPDNRPHYNSTPYNAKKFQFPPLWVIVTFVIALLPFIGVLSYGAIRVFNYIGDLNYNANTYDAELLTGVKASLALASAVIFIGIAVLLLVFITTKMVVRLQNNMPVSVFEIVFGGRFIRALMQQTLQDYASERQTLWENSRYWALETLDLSSTRHELAQPIVPDDVLNSTIPLLPNPNDSETTAAMLLRMGLMNRSGNSVLIGFTEGQKPINFEFEHIGFIALGGTAGTGKTTTAAYIASQIALIPQSCIYVADPHSNRPDSLTRTLQPLKSNNITFVNDAEDIRRVIDEWFDIGSARLQNATNERFPIIFLIIDEFSSLVALEEIPHAQIMRLLTGSMQFRKVQAHGLFAAHQFTGKLVGAGSLGAPFRRATTHHILQRMNADDARILLSDARAARQIAQLETGRAVVRGGIITQPTELAIPHFTSEDFAYIGAMLPHATYPQNGIFAPRVAGVAAVSSASVSDMRPATIETIDASAMADNATSAAFRIAMARQYLRQRTPDGKYAYTIRAVQAMTNLRTATVINISKEIGRSE